ncbi:MAG: hypothetical protein ACLFVU_09470 [Phycisphaerae bacterium]
MTLTIRKLALVGLIGLIVLSGNIVLVAAWLERVGVVDLAASIRREYLTGTAITILVALLILLVSPGRSRAAAWRHRCDVCGRSVFGRTNYCPGCGSRM